MLEIPLIQNSPKPTRSDVIAPVKPVREGQAPDDRDEDFGKVMASHDGDETPDQENTAEASGTATGEDADGKMITTAAFPDKTLNPEGADDEIPGDAEPKTSGESEDDSRPDFTIETETRLPAKRNTTTSELAVLQQAGAGTEKKPQADPETRETAKSADSGNIFAPASDQKNVTILQGAGDTRKTAVAVPGHSPDQKAVPVIGEPVSGSQKTTANEIQSRQLPAQPPATPAENQHRAIPVLPAPTTDEKSGRRSEKLNSVDREFRDIPAAAATRAEIRAAPPAAPVLPAGQGNMQLSQTGRKERTELLPVAGLDADTATQWDPRTSGTGAAQQAIARAETPAMIGRQMAEALQRLPDRPVELALSPKELGRVRMTISAVDGAITVSVLAERPETLDLMRRNIDQLAREFQAIGFNSISFAFSEGQQQTNDDRKNSQPSFTDATAGQGENPSETTPQPVELVATSGLDLRL